MVTVFPMESKVASINRSSPLSVDTDGDGLCDGPISVDGQLGCSGGEDLNADGIRDEDETHPNRIDTDFDGLADGFEDGNQVAWLTKVRPTRALLIPMVMA